MDYFYPLLPRVTVASLLPCSAQMVASHKRTRKGAQRWRRWKGPDRHLGSGGEGAPKGHVASPKRSLRVSRDHSWALQPVRTSCFPAQRLALSHSESAVDPPAGSQIEMIFNYGPPSARKAKPDGAQHSAGFLQGLQMPASCLS